MSLISLPALSDFKCWLALHSPRHSVIRRELQRIDADLSNPDLSLRVSPLLKSIIGKLVANPEESIRHQAAAITAKSMLPLSPKLQLFGLQRLTNNAFNHAGYKQLGNAIAVGIFLDNKRDIQQEFLSELDNGVYATIHEMNSNFQSHKIYDFFENALTALPIMAQYGRLSEFHGNYLHISAPIDPAQQRIVLITLPNITDTDDMILSSNSSVLPLTSPELRANMVLPRLEGETDDMWMLQHFVRQKALVTFLEKSLPDPTDRQFPLYQNTVRFLGYRQ